MLADDRGGLHPKVGGSSTLFQSLAAPSGTPFDRDTNVDSKKKRAT